MDIKNLWPENFMEGKNDIILPVTTLREQAVYFNNMTQNILKASIETQKANFSTKMFASSTGLVHRFKINAPALGNYNFELVSIIQSGILPYPCNLYSSITEIKTEIIDTNNLEENLTILFSNPKISSIIQNLMIQSNV